MGTIRTLSGERFQLKSATKLMEDLDVLDESKSAVWSIIRNNTQDMSEFEALSDEDECDIAFINIKDKGIAVITIQGGYSMFQPVYLPLTGHSMKAILDKDGMIHVFVVRNNRLWHVQEKAPHSRLFTSPEEVFFTLPSGFSRVEKLLLHQLAREDGFVLGVVSKVGNSSYWVSYRQWEARTTFDLIPSSFSSPMLDFTGTEWNDLSLVCLSDSYTSYSIAQRKNNFSYRLELQEEVKVRQICPYGADIFALLESADGKFPVEIRIDRTTDKAIGRALAIHGNYHSMSMYTDEEGKPYIALSGERLNYIRLEKNGQGYEPVEIMPLDKSCTLMSFNKNEKCQRIFYLLDDNKIHVLENQGDVTWIENVLDMPDEGEIRRISCYSTEMTFLRPDNHLVPLQDIEVTLWAESRTYIETAQGIIKLDVDVSVTLRTDMNGKITFKQYTNGLDVPVVYASLAPEYCQEDEAIAISQFADIHAQLSGITSQQLLNAQQTDSMSGVIKPFLPDEYRNEKTASELAKGIQDLMKIQPQGNVLGNGLCLMKRSQLNNVSGVVPHDGLPSWSLDFSSGSPVYTRLTKEEAQREISMMKSRVKKNGNGFFSKIADFFRSVIKGFVSIVKIVVNGIKTVVNFILDGIEMVFEAVITVVQEVFHFVEMVFAAVLIFFVTVFAWLASLFIWDDVMRTKRAIRESFTLLLNKLPTEITKCKPILQGMLKDGQEIIDAAFEKIIQSIVPDRNVNSCLLDNTPEENPEITYEISNNPFNFKFDNMLACEVNLQVVALKAETYPELDEVIRILKEELGNITANQSFIDAANYFENAFSGIDNFLNSLLAALLSVIRGIIQAILEGMYGVISVVFDVLDIILTIFTDMITKTIKIPFFSAFYKILMGNDMCIIDLASMLLALPVTLVNKILGLSSFKTDEDVTAFISQLEERFNGLPVDSNGKTSKIMQVFSTISSIAYFLVGIYLDNSAGNARGKNVILELPDILSLIFESVWLIFSIPVLYKDPSEMEKEDYLLWGCFAFGFCLDLIVSIVVGSHIDRQKYGRIATCIYGFMHAIIAVNTAAKSGVLTLLAELFGSLTEIDKPLIDMDERNSVVGLDVISLIFITAIDISQLVSNNKNLSYERND